MKPSCFAPLSILLYITVLFPQQISLADSQNGHNQLLEIACAQTKAKDLCISVIGSDPRSANGDVTVFSSIVGEKALSEINSLKERCPEVYRKLVGDAGDAIEKSKTKHLIKSAINDVVPCSGAEDYVFTLLDIAVDILN